MKTHWVPSLHDVAYRADGLEVVLASDAREEVEKALKDGFYACHPSAASYIEQEVKKARSEERERIAKIVEETIKRGHESGMFNCGSNPSVYGLLEIIRNPVRPPRPAPLEKLSLPDMIDLPLSDPYAHAFRQIANSVNAIIDRLNTEGKKE